ncbi:MAG: hypothetical protein U0174_05005 [Polyangiaceae bacterium]
MTHRSFAVFSLVLTVATFGCGKDKAGSAAGSDASAASTASSPDNVQNAPNGTPSATSTAASTAEAPAPTATPMIALVPKPVDTSAEAASKGTRRVKMDDAELARIVGSLPSLLSSVGPEVRFFTPDQAGEIARKAKEREREPANGVVFTASPVLWNPEGTQEYLVFTGRSKHSGFVAALKLVPPSGYELVSSFVFQRETTPVVLAYKEGSRRELFWTSCWGCPAEQGSVSIRDDHHVVIVQH